MRVFVAGAGGAVGKRLVPMLVARGHQVTGTASRPESAEAIQRLGAEPVVVDGLDAIGIGQAVAQAEPDAIIHEMTALSGSPDFRQFDRWFALTNRLRTEGTDNLLAAAKASGVKRFVAQSFTGWSNSREGSWIKTEDDPLDPHPVKAQTQTLAAIRYLERAVLEAPLEGIVVRYGGLYGPGSSEKLVEDPEPADVPGHRQRRRRIVRRPTSTMRPVGRSPHSSVAGTASTTSSTTTQRLTREFIPAIAEAVGAQAATPHPRLARPGCSRARSR